MIPAEVSGLDPERVLVLHYPHKWKPYDLADIDYLSAVRKGDWKLVYRMQTGELELYDLSGRAAQPRCRTSRKGEGAGCRARQQAARLEGADAHGAPHGQARRNAR